ncbi:MAG: PD40 domain-containing protein [Spirochaetales bacterium]|nr:PD40 domain-containing protein [Spirochaetales bacterium]
MKKNLFLLFFLIIFCFPILFLTADPEIRALIDNDLYDVGDIINLDIDIRDNPGFHGFYFDLLYDGSVLAFEGIEQGLALRRTGFEGELLYAAATPESSSLGSYHLIVSYSIKDKAILTTEAGTLATLRFRVISSAPVQATFSFQFQNYDIRELKARSLEDAEWINSPAFRIGAIDENLFIVIRKPYDYQVFYADEITLDAIFTNNINYSVIIYNPLTGHTSDPVRGNRGSISGEIIPIDYGFNRIIATLVNQNGDTLAVDTVTVLRSEEDKFIKIISPPDHTLVNTDMVEVRVSSTYSLVTINNEPAEDTGEHDGENGIYQGKIWLKRGFNTISATARNPGGAIYKDTIVVYYQKDESVFRFLLPTDGQTFKTTQENSLHIKGEISSMYKAENILNTVTLKVIYYPLNPLLPARVLVDNKPAVIDESGTDVVNGQAAYVFYNTFPISLEGLETGQIEIIAYKNKQGINYEDTIHRFIYVDNSHLAINLVQPHIFSLDELDTKKKVNDFNEGEALFDGMTVTKTGGFSLERGEACALEEDLFSGKTVIDMIELTDGTLAVLVNENNMMRIYRKMPGEESWELYISRNDMVGYDLCETDIGILIGVSNLYNMDASGLYLIQDDSLINVQIGEPIPHVQYIENHNGLIFLYGNDYSHMFTFSIFSLEHTGECLQTNAASALSLHNDTFLHQFVLSSDGYTGLLRNQENAVSFFQQDETGGYYPADINTTYELSTGRFSTVVSGEYVNGEYSCWLLIKEGAKEAIVIMENKKTHRMIYVDESIDLDFGEAETLEGVCFKNNRFYFVHKTLAHEYVLRSAQILFNQVYMDDEPETYLSGEDTSTENSSLTLLATTFNNFYLGYGFADSTICQLTHLLPEEGMTSFIYKNRDIEGLRGFRFEVEPIWLYSDGIELGFGCLTQEGDVLWKSEKISLSKFAETTSPHYLLYHNYDPDIGKEVISIEFKELLKDTFLQFDISILSQEYISPSLSGLTIDKKIPVKLPRSSEEVILLPVKGYVHDPTVTEVTIQQVKVPLERDGSFSYNYPVYSSRDEIPMELYCYNSVGESASLNFLIKIFESKNDITGVVFEDDNGSFLTPDTTGTITTESENLFISGKYFGLIGVMTGYELYALHYDSQGNKEFVILHKGIFENEKDSIVDPVFDCTEPGYESGIITHQKIKLYPGDQRLILYAENPGGWRKEFTVGGNPVSIHYDLPETSQQIVLTNHDIILLDSANTEENDRIYIHESITFDKQLNLSIPEVYDNQSKEFIFQKKYLLNGEIKSLYNFYNLKVKSYKPALTFENGKQEIIVDVDEINRFEVTFTINMPEDTPGEIYDIAFIPTAPFLNWMKTGLSVIAEKNFESTMIIPDFSLIDPRKHPWSDEEKCSLSHPLFVNFSRYVPPGSRLHLMVNFETLISGDLVELNPGEGVYKITEHMEELLLTGVKPGNNRIQWWITWDGGKVISSSRSGKEDMYDFLFPLAGDTSYQPTVISFPVDSRVYYNDTDKKIPPLNITKDYYTDLLVLLNGTTIIAIKEGEDSIVISPSDYTAREGKNEFIVSYAERNGEKQTFSYYFLYDTACPVITKASYIYDETYDHLISYSVIVKEANLEDAMFLTIDRITWENEVISQVNVLPEIIYLKDDFYHIAWTGLERIDPPLRPSHDYPVSVRAIDASAKANSELHYFYGLEPGDRPVMEELHEIDISSGYYNGIPYFEGEEGSGPFPGQVKIYNSSITVENAQFEKDYLIERPDKITMNPGFSVTSPNSLVLHAGGNIGCAQGFSIPPGMNLHAEAGYDRELVPPAQPAFFTMEEDSHSLSLIFRFRSEEKEHYAFTPGFRRILTLFDSFSDNLRRSLYLGYRDESPGPGDEYYYVVDEFTEYVIEVDENNEEIIVENIDPVILMGGPETPLEILPDSGYNIIILGIEDITQTLHVSINNSVPLSVEYNEDSAEEIIRAILSPGHEFYFGSLYPQRAGHYSIARPLYINRIIGIEDLKENADLSNIIIDDVNIEQRRTYHFDTDSDKIGNGFYELRTRGSDYFNTFENADYLEPESCGSLKASKRQKNVLVLKDQDQLLFSDAEYPIVYNLNITHDAESLLFSPTETRYSGKYYFGNALTNHGLSNDRWYSVKGEVFPYTKEGIPIDVDAQLVLRIAEKEQIYSLREGKFQFVFENPSMGIPGPVIMYLEVNNPLKLSNHLILTEGNYGMPEEGFYGLEQSSASASYRFHSAGTIDFMYKPFNVNNYGFVDYPVVLLDSEYVKIYTKKSDYHFTTYSLELKDNLFPVSVDTDVPVKPGWQHIQVSYNVNDQIVYLYIDGKVAGCRKNIELPVSPSMRGHPVNNDNLFIGSDMGSLYFAQGYIDELRLSNLYRESLYESITPLSFSYTDTPAPELTCIVHDSGFPFGDSVYSLESVDGSYYSRIETASVYDHGFNIPGLLSGKYILVLDTTINNHRYNEVFSFIKDDKPCFRLTSVTPLIIRGLEKDTRFSLVFDDSYILKPHESIYGGFGIRIRGERDDAPFSEVLYVIQDFSTVDHTQWLITDGTQPALPFNPQGDSMNVIFPGIISSSPVHWDIRSFYYNGVFTLTQEDFDTLDPEKQGVIPEASMTLEVLPLDCEIKHKLGIQVGTTIGVSDGDNYRDIRIGCEVVNLVTGKKTVAGESFELNSAGYADLYFDDILPHFGDFECTVFLQYKGQTYGSEAVIVHWEDETETFTFVKEKRLFLYDFSLLNIERNEDNTGTVQLYLEYESNALTDIIRYQLLVYSPDTGMTYEAPIQGTLSPLETYHIFNTIHIPKGRSIIKLKVQSEGDGISRSADLTLVNSISAPDIVITNNVPTLIGYNNVLFTWKGYHEGIFKPDIHYSYNFDYKGWSAENKEWRKLELYNLDEGFHNFRVKAIFQGEESYEATANFFVDITRPVFHEHEIEIRKIYDEYGIPYEVTLYGRPGAITDSSLTGFTINGEVYDLGDGGSFYAEHIPLLYDGENKFVLTAYDKVGNFSDHTIVVENNLTRILFPEKDRNVRYAPMVLVGEIDRSLNVEIDIYLSDPTCPDIGNSRFTGWKKAKINEDYTFFIEDIFINPGTVSREAHTPLTMAVCVKSGKVFYKQIDVWANEILMPIEMNLSTHAVEGENSDTEVTIDCHARVPNISSWSIDFDGDGNYDMVDMVDNPDFGNSHSWVHTYSSLGLVSPRVRVISLDGNYFSVKDDIIIHEKIKEASNKMVEHPVSFSSLRMDDGTYRLYVLSGEQNNDTIEVFEVGQNENYISERLFSISLAGMGIENPVKIVAGDNDHLFIASNRNLRGYIDLLKANEMGNYLPVPECQVLIDDMVYDMTVTDTALHVSVENGNYLAKIPLIDGIPVANQLEYITPTVRYAEEPGACLSITNNGGEFLISDFYRQRILKLSDSLNVLEYFGTFGYDEGEFITPSIIESFENRMFIYDRGRGDVQIFGPDFHAVTTLAYSTGEGYDNYVDPEFLVDIADIAIITKIENNRLYYYLLLLSRSAEKLAMFRLPQWEELRAHVHNNKIVFLKDREVYTAKPSGSDLMKILSSDSILRVEGTLDYPALSPDGRQLVFTSRVRLYEGTNTPVDGEENGYVYDNLYTINVNGEDLRRIPLDGITDYMIERPLFNSNGDELIFSARPVDGTWQIYIYNLKTGGIRMPFQSDENARFPAFSPDDHYIVFTTDYDGDEEIEIIDLENPNVRVDVTSNNARDSFPVWSVTYPFEIMNPDLHITSKIGFVSERDFHKGVYFTYIARPYEGDVRVVTETGKETNDTPDMAAMEITPVDTEGDYPCFTGDGNSIVFEHFDGDQYLLKKFNYKTDELTTVSLPQNVRKPAGMKNAIADFTAEPVNGNAVSLRWREYVDKEIFYTVHFQINKEGEGITQKRIFTLNNARLTGLEMGAEYLFRISIVENGEEAAASQWKKVKMPGVIALPAFEIDEHNPYRVLLQAWTPDPDVDWNFAWIIDNQEITTAHTSPKFSYEFATSGRKEIMLKVTNKKNSETDFTEVPMIVDIISDIKPVIEYTIDNSYTLYLNAKNSFGNNIDWPATTWIISGPGRMPMTPQTGSEIYIPLVTEDHMNFKHKINVTLNLKRRAITGQPEADIIESNMIIDLDYRDVKPIITYEPDTTDPLLITFTGTNSIGLINWYEARWNVYADGIDIHGEQGVSSFAYQFPETGSALSYSVTLTVPNMIDGTTMTGSVIVSIEPSPIEPVIDYEIITLKEDDNIVGAKLLLNCTNSKGNNINYMEAKWTVPVAGTYNEQPTQFGPVAVYNLMNIGERTQMDVSLTLSRRGGTDITSLSKTIYVDARNMQEPEIIFNAKKEYTNTGTMLVVDILSSTGPNIEWEKTTWLFDGEYSFQGPVVRRDISAAPEDAVITYVCTVYCAGNEPMVKHGEVEIGQRAISPFITYTQLPGGAGNVFSLDVRESRGINIDWERTTWYIFDGNENVVTKYGGVITHAFSIKEKKMGYPVLVEMFFKGSSRPFISYTSIDVEGDEFLPLITWDLPSEREDENLILFSAGDSVGRNIDWSQAKWTFGDYSESEYGPVASHKYGFSKTKKSYKVSLTLTRRSANGSLETKTTTTTISIGSDVIKAVVHAKLNSNGFLVLSAEESEGRGLLLDRCYWLFEGEGEGEEHSEHTEGGVIQRRQTSFSTDLYAKASIGLYLNAGAGYGFGDKNSGGPYGFVEAGTNISAEVGAGASMGYDVMYDFADYKGYTNENDSFSTSNTHTGAVCRRYVDRDESNVLVTLYVYRMSLDGGIEGESITTRINCDDAKSSGGVTYGK